MVPRARTLACMVHLHASKTPEATAVLSPFSATMPSMSYKSLSKRATGLAAALQGDIVASDLPNTEDNLLLQVALSHFGASIATVKDEDALAKLGPQVQGAVVSSSSAWLAKRRGWRNAPIIVEDGSEWAEICMEGVVYGAEANEVAASDETATAAIFSGKKITAGNVVKLGEEAAEGLQVTGQDLICVAVTLMHPFGIASGVGAALTRGACLVLPDASGIKGCGNPNQRANASLRAMRDTGCTLLVGDSHTIKGLQELLAEGAGTIGSLRGGVCKVGSGNDFLSLTDVNEADAKLLTLAGVILRPFGQKKV